MEKIFITADTHFGHEKIIKMCNRPFSSVEEMDNFIVEKWNSLIDKKDKVYIVGDFAFKNHVSYLKKLKGKKHLIIGSHDSINKEIESFFESVSDIKTIKFNGRHFILSHCPMRRWEDNYRGSIHLFGHTHGRMKTFNLSFDIGMDTNNLSPYNIEELLVLVKNREIEMISNNRINFSSNGEKKFFQDDVDWFQFLMNRGSKN